MSMLHGIHWSPSGGTDRCRAVAAILDGCFLMLGGNHRPEDVAAWPAATIIVRLPTPAVWENPATWIARVSPIIQQWAVRPGVLYQLGNEVDILDGSDVRFAAWKPVDWLQAAPRFVASLRAAHPGILLGSTPLSVTATAQITPEYCALWDAVCVHSYADWQHPETVTNPNLGQSYRHALAVADGRAVYVTEAGVSNFAGGDWHARNALLAAWMRQADADGVRGACLFVADASPDWASFDIGPEAATDIKALLTPPSPPPPAPPPPIVPPAPPTPPTGAYTRASDPRGYRALDPRWRPFIAAHNPDEADAICTAYEEGCRAIGYDANCAIAQGCVECTIFTSDRWRNAHASAGIGIYADGTPDVIWGAAPHGDARTGILAQCELLSDYYGDGREPWGILAPHGFGGMTLRKTRLDQMDGVWAADTTYSAAIVGYLNRVMGGQPAPAPTPPPIVTPTWVTGDTIIAAWTPDIGKDTFIDEGVSVPSYYRCEEAVEVMEERCGLSRLRYPDANADMDSSPLNQGIAPIGARVFFRGPGWSQYGHVGHAYDSSGKTISALTVVTIKDGWQNPAVGYQGWRYAPGVGPGSGPAPVPAPAPVPTPPAPDGYSHPEVLRMWFGGKSDAEKSDPRFAFHDGWGIETAYDAALNGRHPQFPGTPYVLGEVLSDEEGDPGTPGRSIRYYSNGKISAYREPDGSYKTVIN